MRYTPPWLGVRFDDLRTWEDRAVSKSLDIPPRQIISWTERGLVQAAHEPGGERRGRRYDIFNLFQFSLLAALWRVGGKVELMEKALDAIGRAGLGLVFFQQRLMHELWVEKKKEGAAFLPQRFRRYLVMFPPQREQRVDILVRIPRGDDPYALNCRSSSTRIEAGDDLFLDESHVQMTAKPEAHARWTWDELLPGPGNPTLILMDLTALKEELEERIEGQSTSGT